MHIEDIWCVLMVCYCMCFIYTNVKLNSQYQGCKFYDQCMLNFLLLIPCKSHYLPFVLLGDLEGYWSYEDLLIINENQIYLKWLCTNIQRLQNKPYVTCTELLWWQTICAWIIMIILLVHNEIEALKSKGTVKILNLFNGHWCLHVHDYILP